MKKLLPLLSVILLLLSLAGCSINPPASTVDTGSSSNNQPSSITEPETIPKPVITDYSVTGMMNVTDVYFSGKDSRGYYCKVGTYGVDTATAITVHIMCPQCGEETFDIIDFSKISENLIGQQTFTWTDEESCGNWSNHSDSFNSNYKYSIIFTLNA